MEDSGLYREYIFYKNYIILIDDPYSTSVYDTQKLYNPENYQFPNMRLYKRVFLLFPYWDYFEDHSKSPYNYNDSYSSFDTNTGILTVHLRIEKGKPFVLRYYQFDETNGKFIPLTNTNVSVTTETYALLTGDNVNV